MFILREGLAIAPLEAACQRLGIAQADFVPLNAVTEGQASTVMQADALLEDDEAVLIYNIDTYG